MVSKTSEDDISVGSYTVVTIKAVFLEQRRDVPGIVRYCSRGWSGDRRDFRRNRALRIVNLGHGSFPANSSLPNYAWVAGTTVSQDRNDTQRFQATWVHGVFGKVSPGALQTSKGGIPHFEVACPASKPDQY
jgi:hypothetical protein